MSWVYNEHKYNDWVESHDNLSHYMRLIQESDQTPAKKGHQNQIFPVWASCLALFTVKQNELLRTQVQNYGTAKGKCFSVCRVCSLKPRVPRLLSAYKPCSQWEHLCQDQWGKGMHVANTVCCFLLIMSITQIDPNMQEWLTIKLFKNCPVSISLMFCGETEVYKNVHIHRN